MKNRLAVKPQSAILTLAKPTQEIAKPLLERHKLTFFDFVRHYDDGSCIIFSTNPELTEYFFCKNYQLIAPVPDALVSDRFRYLLPETGSYSRAVHDARNIFNAAYPIDLFERHDHYFDMFCFTSSKYRSDAFNSYLNNIEMLEKFGDFFKEKVKLILDNPDPHKILLPEGMKASINWNRLKQNQGRADQLFTPRELSCLKFLTEGSTSRQIALGLGISYRTAEVHIENIKQKLGCARKSEIPKALFRYSFEKMSE